MAEVYILYSSEVDRYYVGSCLEFSFRFERHRNKAYRGSFTTRANDWAVKMRFENLNYGQARKIENHIKRMKSRKFIEDVIKYSDLRLKLEKLYK